VFSVVGFGELDRLGVLTLPY